MPSTSTVDPRICDFIEEHHVLTLATTVAGKPWTAACFYAYMRAENRFVFTTDLKTRHGDEMAKNSSVAANIILETSVVGKIQGVQISGTVERPKGELLSAAKKRYLKRFPVARLLDPELWTLTPDLLKMTHNRLGFGKKLFWHDTEK